MRAINKYTWKKFASKKLLLIIFGYKKIAPNKFATKNCFKHQSSKILENQKKNLIESKEINERTFNILQGKLKKNQKKFVSESDDNNDPSEFESTTSISSSSTKENDSLLANNGPKKCQDILNAISQGRYSRDIRATSESQHHDETLKKLKNLNEENFLLKEKSVELFETVQIKFPLLEILSFEIF
ncbi:hypothetical protein BpHYR1_009624 [Brachionus plicatilis]|uniref:Uncharacterized protein n=1 Tax=Brachionus plicatilis TaxID=10195 RepID=A0A3M7SRC3_BRAPC|nr:hypothetical protein BpHYR1_009624 [Brachionus plicatilis]